MNHQILVVTMIGNMVVLPTHVGLEQFEYGIFIKFMCYGSCGEYVIIISKL